MAAKILYARLKPHDPKRGCLMRTYTIWKFHFVAGGPALDVPEEIGEKLRGVVNQSEKEALAFDVSDKPFSEAAPKRSAQPVVETGEVRSARDEKRAAKAGGGQKPDQPAPAGNAEG
jgi:hypothetical protein